MNVAMVGLGSFEDVQKAFIMAKEDLSEILSGKAIPRKVKYKAKWV